MPKEAFCSQRLLSIFYTIFFYKFVCLTQPFQWASALPTNQDCFLSSLAIFVIIFYNYDNFIYIINL